MDFLEKDLEEIIYSTNMELLCKKGLKIKGKLLRQVKIGNYGIADLIQVRKDYCSSNPKVIPILIIDLIELKKEKISVSAFMQAVRYVKGIVRYFEKRNINYELSINMILIGKSFDIDSSLVYLTDLLNGDWDKGFLSLYTYSYGLNGIEFKNEHGYKLTNEGF